MSGPTGSLLELLGLMPSPETAERVDAYVHHHLPAFKRLLREIPIPPGRGSMSTAEAFWLNRLVADVRPTTIIDSGSATGWSAWIMADAAPEARVLCFDPYRDPDLLPNGAEFMRADWTSVTAEVGRDTFALFDDHVNQRRRVLQSQRAGLINVVFHDVYRQLTRSIVSLAFVDLVGRAEFMHTFEPLWHTDPTFRDTSDNPQMYRYLTWVRLAPHPGKRVGPRWTATRQRLASRNPTADDRSQLNWRARG